MVREGLNPRWLRPLAGLALAGLLACVPHRAPSARPDVNQPPATPREFRAAWVATVANIDWPSAKGLPVAAQQAEARTLIAKARDLGLNTLILQVRPAADALYASPLEPWSEYLTGTQGQAPEPRYDPLAFWIAEAHAAGLQLHAWFNPYRARAASAVSPLAATHLAITHPELVRSYGDQLWLDPGEPAATEHTLAVILDVVRRYAVDGVHIDDYFYPYPIKGSGELPLDFPDDPSWQAYLASGGTLDRADWRRRNVDRLVACIYQEVHRLKPKVLVGVSPFGLGRPDRRPPGIAGFSQYDSLYADPEHWLAEGWLDYLAPQLYWKRETREQAFAPLLDYWRGQNTRQRHLWPGLFTSRLSGKEPWAPDEIVAQIQLIRDRVPLPGHAHFSAAALLRDDGGIDARLAELYGGPALVPASPWLEGHAPPPPTVALEPLPDHPQALRLRAKEEPGTAWLGVWARYGPDWRFLVLPSQGGTLPAPGKGQALQAVRVTAVDAAGRESTAVSLTVTQP